MFNVKNLLMCPVCQRPLDEALRCPKCGTDYEYKYGVYRLVSPKISSDQKIVWNIPEEALSDDVADGAFVETGTEWTEDYEAGKNEETREAEKRLAACMDLLISRFSGTTCDLATGRGALLRRMLASENKNFSIVCTDISDRILALTRKSLRSDDARVAWVACDARRASLRDNSFDYVTSFGGLGVVPDTPRVAAELYRMLKPGGRLIVQGRYIEKDSDSFELAEMVGMEREMTEEYLLEDLRGAGFRNVISTLVATATWAENSYDLLPIAGDTLRYCVVSAEKPLP